MLKNKIIAIEGPDGSGKSHLSKYFIDEYKAAYIHVNNYSDKEKTMSQHLPMVEFGRNWAKKLSLSSVILDRHWLTLLVYSFVFDKPEEAMKVDQFIMSHWNDFFFDIDYMFICLPPREEYLKHFEELKTTRNEMFSNMEMIYECFDGLMWGDVSKTPLSNSLVAKKICTVNGLVNFKGVIEYNYMDLVAKNLSIADWLKMRGLKND